MATTKERATVQLSDSAKAEVDAAAEKLGLTVPEYIRRSLALTRTLDDYMDNGRLTVIERQEDEDGKVTEQKILIATLTA